MKSKDNNLEKNISRLVKLAGDSNKPTKAFTDSLTDNAIDELKRPVHTKFTLLRTRTWLGAAAAVLLIGFLLLVPDLVRQGKQDRQSARKPGPIIQKPELEAASGKDLDKRTRLATRTDIAGFVADSLAEEIMPEQPPFAPASAIELVTLPRRDNVQITIYNSADLTLVRERRNLTLKKGWNWLQFMWANTLIDPTSLSLEPMADVDKIDIQQLVFPARLKDIGRWLIRSQVTGQVPFEITYFTSGLSWRAFYMGTLSGDERKMKLASYVRVANNSGEDYENAQTRLIVGKVHQLDKIAELAKRQYPYGSPQTLEKYNVSGMVDYDAGFGIRRAGIAGKVIEEFTDLASKKEITKEGLSEYFLYTIEGTETIPDKWGKRLMSFDIDDIEVRSLYKYDEQRWGKQTIRFTSFANDKEHNLGDTPIPNGAVRIFSQTDTNGYLSYVGQTNVKYIPVDEEVQLNLGPARLVSVEPVITNFKTDNYIFDNNGNVAGWDEIRTWKIEITNTRRMPIEIETTRGFGTAYWTLEHNGEDISYEKHDATHARFKAKLQPQTKRSFFYTVTTYHGRREESLTKTKIE